VVELKNWGSNSWKSFYKAFYGCSNMKITATDHATAKTSFVQSFSEAFKNCSSLTEFPLIDTSAATTFYAAWQGCSALVTFPLIDTSSCVHFEYAWLNCSKLISFPLLDTSNGEYFNGTWQACVALTSFPTLNVSKGRVFRSTWAYAYGMYKKDFPLLDLSSLQDGFGIFANVTFSVQSYSDILVKMATDNQNANVTFSGGNTKVNLSGDAAKQTLINDRGWSISDGGLE